MFGIILDPSQPLTSPTSDEAVDLFQSAHVSECVTPLYIHLSRKEHNTQHLKLHNLVLMSPPPRHLSRLGETTEPYCTAAC